jgi:hypothetical protein
MAFERNPNDPRYEDPAASDLRRSTYEDPAANDLRRSTRLDQELQADPELTESRVSGGRIAAAVVAIILLIGGLYYGMNMSATSPSSTASQTTPANQNNAQSTTAPAVRDVTPNRDAGTTTGSAPASPQTPASPPSNSGTNPSR